MQGGTETEMIALLMIADNFQELLNFFYSQSNIVAQSKWL